MKLQKRYEQKLKAKDTPEQIKERQINDNAKHIKLRRKKKLLKPDTYRSGWLLPGDSLPKPWHPGPFRENDCQLCGAHFFARELHRCCFDGQVDLPKFENDYPHIVKQLFTDSKWPKHKHFRQMVRTYNGLLAPMSRKVDVVDQPHIGKQTTGPLFYKIYGTIDYLMGTLKPKNNNSRPLFLQLYLYDAAAAATEQLKSMNHELRNKIDSDLLFSLHRILREHYPLAKNLKSMFEIIEKQEKDTAEKDGRPIKEIEIKIVKKVGSDKRYSIPTSNAEIALLHPLVNSDASAGVPLITVTDRRDGTLSNVNYLCELIDTYIFSLIHFTEQPGWNTNMILLPKKTKTVPKKVKSNDRQKYDRLTMAKYYLFYARKRSDWSPALGSGALTLQYFTEAWYKIVQNKLTFLHDDQNSETVSN